MSPIEHVQQAKNEIKIDSLQVETDGNEIEKVNVSHPLASIEGSVGPQTLGFALFQLAVTADLISLEGSLATPPEVPPDLGRAGESTGLRPVLSKSRKRS